MLAAHLPAGYLLTRALLACVPAGRLDPGEPRRLLAAGLLASVLPDFDLAYHVLIDPGTPHRAYWTHTPLFWLVLALAAWALARWRRRPQWTRFTAIVLANVLLHLALDSISGPVRWLHPFSPEYFRLIHVARGPHGWLWAHLTHWTMLLEAGITLAAAALALGFPLRRRGRCAVVRIAPYSLRR
jgi:inner membrane protein